MCGNGRPDPTPDGQPTTCKCRTCGAIEAVAAAPAASSPSPHDVRLVGLAPALPMTEPTSGPLPAAFCGEGPSGHFARSHCALIILLGHLLL